MAYSLLEITYGLTGSFRAGDTSPSPRYWDSNTAPGSRYAGSGSLSSWWRLNDDVSASGNVIDWNGNANPGTFADIVTRPTYSSTLTPSTYVQNAVTGSSRLSGSCTFDGDDNGVTVGTAATWNDIIGNDTNGTSLMTFAMWVYKTGDGAIGAGSSTGRFFDFGRGNEAATDGVVRMWSNASEKIRFNTLWDDVWKDFDTAAGVFSLNTWTHVAITYDATAGSNVPKIYINGSEVTVTAQDSAGTAWNGIKVTDCTIANHRVGGYGWQGSMGDVAVWNSILTAEEIKAVYEISNTGAYKIVRNFELRGSNADPGFTGSVARFIQGYNVDSYDRFAAAITPLIGRGDINNVFLSSSSGVTEVPRTAYFDESRKLANDIPSWPVLSASIDNDPESATYGRVTYTRLPPEPKTVTIGDDDYRVIETPGYVMEQRAFGYQREWAENAEPFAELSKWDPTRYLENQLTFMWPVVLSNPNAIDPFEFSGVIEPFTIRKRITQTGTFVGDYDDPYPNSFKAGVSSGEIVEATRRRNFKLSNFYNVKSKQFFAPFGSAQSPEITELTAFTASFSKITSQSLARLDILSASSDTAYLDTRAVLTRSLSSFRGPSYPMVSAATGTIDHYQDSFVYQRFLSTTYDETIYDWRSYSAASLPYSLTSGSWLGNDPARVIEFPEIEKYEYSSNKPPALQGWWRLNQDLATGSVDDSSGKNRHGTFGNDYRRPSFAKDTSPSKFIQTGSNNFHSGSNAINIGQATLWDGLIGAGSSGKKMTFACWFYIDSELLEASGLDQHRIVDFGQSDIYLGHRKSGSSVGRLEFLATWSTKAGWWATSYGDVELDKWNHIVLSYEASSISKKPSLYLNGTAGTLDAAGDDRVWLVEELSTPAGTYSGILSQDCYIGNRSTIDSAFVGKIADFAIWNSRFGPDVAKSLFYAATSGPYALSASYVLNKPKTTPMGRPEFTSKSTNVGFTYATNETGIDSLAYMGLKK